MPELRTSRLSDLARVAAWLQSETECRLWCGDRVAYPIDLEALPHAIEYAASDSWTLAADGHPVAFGQLVPKPEGRLHLARLITAPAHRREGLGRLITSHLLKTALARKPSSISLNVLAENQAAIALYRSLGFAPVPRPPDERESRSVYMEHVSTAQASVRSG